VNRFVALTLAAGFACALAAGAAEPTPQALLTDALLCKGDPLATVRKMAESDDTEWLRELAVEWTDRRTPVRARKR